MPPARHRISPSTVPIVMAHETPLLTIRSGRLDLLFAAEITVGFVASVLAEARV
jgi:hypothetical protein